MNQNALYNLSYGVYLISTLDSDRPTGCIANSAMQITVEPATIALSLNHNNYTNTCIEKSGVFALSILGEHSAPNLITTFGFQSGRDVNKFDGIDYQLKSGLPIINDCCSYIVCNVINKMETDTHTIFLGQIIDCDIKKDDTAMTYAYYHRVIKGNGTQTSKTEETKESAYVCSVCNYVYDGDTPFEELPDDYICPICKQPKSAFRKQ